MFNVLISSSYFRDRISHAHLQLPTYLTGSNVLRDGQLRVESTTLFLLLRSRARILRDETDTIRYFS